MKAGRVETPGPLFVRRGAGGAEQPRRMNELSIMVRQTLGQFLRIESNGLNAYKMRCAKKGSRSIYGDAREPPENQSRVLLGGR